MTDDLRRQLDKHRIRRGWTRHQLAEAAGLAPQNLSQILRGRRAMGLDVLTRLTDALGLELRLAKVRQKRKRQSASSKAT